MLAEDEYYARLMQEAEEIKREQPSFSPINNDITNWSGFIIGTGLYEGGVFCFEIIIPREYPFKPPKIKWKTEIFHPNFYRDRICVGILAQDWTAANNIVQVIESVRFLLTNPNPHDPLHSAAAKMYMEQPEEFEKRAREMVEKYATFDQPCVDF